MLGKLRITERKCSKIQFLKTEWSIKWEKSHTCEEGGPHLRISVWHLLINLKNNYLLKKLLKWANKKCMKFIIFNVVFSLKNKEKPGSWDTEWDRHKFLSFWAIFSILPPSPPYPNNPQNHWKFWKYEKKHLEM